MRVGRINYKRFLKSAGCSRYRYSRSFLVSFGGLNMV